MKLGGFFAFCVVLIGTDFAFAQAPEAMEESEEVVTAPVPTAEASGNLFAEQRKSYLALLTREVESNLPSRDVQKLNQNVQRLGSYRFEWSKSAKDFLLANAPVAELMLYKYAAYKNIGLSSRILDTVMALENFRYPPAAVAFSEILGIDFESKIKTMSIMARAVSQDASLANDALTLISSPWGAEISATEKLYFLSRICGSLRKSGASLPAAFSTWSAESQSFWGRLLAQEVSACQKGI